MRRRLYLTIIMLILIVLSGCNKNKTKDENAQLTVSPSPQVVVTTLPEEITQGTTDGQELNTYKLADYFPIQADTKYEYEGEGNEYASYTVFTDFVDSASSKIQTRTDNGGSETVRVIELKDGKVSVNFIANECYYRDSFMDKSASGKTEILLMEPLVVGTQWTLSDGRKRYISAIDVKIETPSGSYQAIEVTTQETDGETKDYYAPKLGLIRSVYSSGDFEVSSTLKERKTNIPFVEIIDVYYPDTEGKVYAEPLTLSFRTNDITKEVLVKALRQEAIKESYIPIVSENTIINSLFLRDDGIVCVDFSSDLVKNMNLGSGYEELLLQCITNTLGNYYGVQEVYITVGGKPYESGHIQMKEGETFKVNPELVKQ